ncbi:MAG TPA: hypothetical protein VGI10_23710 [Polyangiaceae bacterium]|jgi:hypothetical protein
MHFAEQGLRIVEHAHGHLAWLSTLALAHPALLLRARRRSVRLSASIATGLVTLTGALGASLYPAYRSTLKPAIFASSPMVGNLFERKEHLAVAVVVLAWVGLCAHWAQTRERPELARLAFVAYAGAAALALTCAVLGVAVAVARSF